MTRCFWLHSVHADVAEFVSKCDACQKAKSRTQRPPGQLQSLPIPAYPWQHVTMDFITGLPVTPRWYDCIAVIVDRPTSLSALFPQLQM